jgi:hypothetical protein
VVKLNALALVQLLGCPMIALKELPGKRRHWDLCVEICHCWFFGNPPNSSGWFPKCFLQMLQASRPLLGSEFYFFPIET